MATIDVLARRLNQTPFFEVRIAQRKVPHVTSARVEMGYDMATPSANVTVAQTGAPFWAEGDEIRIDMGYKGPGGLLLPTFAGEVESDNRKYSPRLIDVQAAGYSKRLLRPYGNAAVAELNTTGPAFSYNNQTDTQIWNDLMRRAGVPRYSGGDGDSITYATQQAYDVTAGSKLGDIVSKLDESSKSGQRTFEVAGLVLRKAVLGVPSANVVWRYAEGVAGLTAPFLPIIEITRNVSIKDIQNQAIVKGIGIASETDTTPTPTQASVQAVNDKLGKDGDGNDIYVPHTLSSDFLETRDQCTDVARRYMIEFNKETDDLTLRVALNPAIFPGQSIGITSAKMDLGSQRPYWVRHVSHEVSASGAFTTMQCEGGAGPEGYLLGLPPVAAFEMFVTAEAFEVGGVMDMWYTVTCDASSSFDADGPIAGYAWTATNGASGSGVTWSVRFNQAQWDDPDTLITLTVTDSDTDPTGPHHNTLEQSPVGAEGDETQVDGIYVAANGQADATADGGLTWGTWTPDGGAHVISVTRLCPGFAYFGLDDGRLVLTEDHLLEAPTVVHTFPAAVTAVWISEIDAAKVLVGLQNGDVWLTIDAFETLPLLRRNFSWPINWITGSIEQISQWRVATGSYVWITYDDFATVGTLSTQANKVQQIELSNYANYNVEDVDANIKIEVVGVSLSYPTVSPAPTAAYLAHFLRTDELMVADDQSRVFIKRSDTNAMEAATSIAGGAAHALMAARTNPKVFYAGTDAGVYKTYDEAFSWFRVRNYEAAGLDALQLGLDSEPVAPRIIASIQEFVVGHLTDIGGLSPYGGYVIPGVDGGSERTYEMAVDNGWTRGIVYGRNFDTPNPPESLYPDFWLPAFDPEAAGWKDTNVVSPPMEYLPRAWLVSAGPDPASDGYFAWRHVMAVPASVNPYLKATLVVFGWKLLQKIWFNGTQIHGPGNPRAAQETQHRPEQISAVDWTGYAHTIDGMYHIDVTDLLINGDNNILAGWQDTRPGGLDKSVMAFRLTYNTAPTLATATVGAGALFVSNIEESRSYLLFDRDEFRDTPNGSAGPYLIGPPEGWTNPSFDDSGWTRPQTMRQARTDTLDIDSPGVSLLHGSQWLSASTDMPNNDTVGIGGAIRQHWSIPEGEYTSAILHLKWTHTIKAWLNGVLVHQDDSDNAPGDPPFTNNRGKDGAAHGIDVFAHILPGQDNVLCLQVQRPDTYPQIWKLGDYVSVCALMEVL